MQEVINTVTRILLNHRIDSYNRKLISSCLKQTLTLTLGPVTPTVTIMPEEADGAEEALAAEVGAVAETITERQSLNIHLKEKCKMILFPNSQLPKVDNKLLNTRIFLMLYQYFAQIKDTNLSTISFKQTPRNCNRFLRRCIHLHHCGRIHIM